MTILIKDCTAITMSDPFVRRGVSIAIKDGKISKISEDPAAFAGQRFDTVIDGKGKLALPGFVNAHTHLAMVLLRGYSDDRNLHDWLEQDIWPAERKLTEADVYWASLVGIAEMLRSGTTTFSDMYFFMDAVAQAVKESGMRAVLSYGIIAPQPGEKAQKELAITEKFLRDWHTGAEGRIRVAVGPHAPYTCCNEVWQDARDLAIQYNTLIHTHLQETLTEVNDSIRQYHQSPTERLAALRVFEAKTVIAHGVHLSDSDVKILVQHGVGLAHCPTSNLKLGSGIAPVQKYKDMGLAVGIGTDGAASNNNLDMLEELRLAALLAKRSDPTALPAADALRMATSTGAQILGLEGVGHLAEGAPADIIVVDTQGAHWQPGHNPVSDLVYAAHASDVETVIIAGRVVMKDREIRTFDEAKATQKVRALSAKYRRN
uniref:5-methylthioadenosine/S-adenosylhomocysteine deaminase n=1 Tax=Acetithermum autotrophicum TaxID=1446466 RepID=H5SSL5_ACEAU|nr:amidohydrolase family [Candidatus Acetothermum autotrophicum]